MRKSIFSLSFLFVIFFFAGVVSATAPSSKKPIAVDCLPDSIVRMSFFPVNIDSLKKAHLDGLNKDAAPSGVYFVDCNPNVMQFTNGDYELYSSNGDMYLNARVYLKASSSEQEAVEVIKTDNLKFKEDIDEKAQPFYTEYSPFSKAGSDAMVYSGYNTSTERTKMLLRFRVKKLVMTIETSGVEKDIAMNKFAELYDIAKVNMEKY